MRARWVGLFMAVAAGAIFGLFQCLAGAASAAGTSVTERVIVVFRNQDPAQPASPQFLDQREASFRASRSAVVDQLFAAGARAVHSYNVINAVSATVTSAEAARLRADRAVSEVVPDQLIQMATPTRDTATTAASNATDLNGCAAPGHTELDPQALETIAADSGVPGAKTARSLGLTGAGVKVAFIADGVNINDPDFIRADGKPVFIDYKDFSGDGTSSPTAGGEAFLDSSSIAAQGRATYDVSDYTATPLSHPCDIRIEGVAPGASLVGLDVFGDTDDAYDSTFLEALDYAVTVDKVNVINESLGSNYYPDDAGSLDLIKQANDAATAAGATVTVSAGDAGPTGTIGTPATDPHVIDAGASTTFRGYLQTGSGGVQVPGVSGWLNDNLSGLSSAGYDQTGGTVDVLAPGDLNWALCTADKAMYSDCVDLAGNPTNFQLTGGTSEAAPLTAGVAALVIQAYREGHHGATPSAALVKRLIVSTTDDVGQPADEQGAGRIDAYKATLAAESFNGGRRAHHRGAPLTVVDGTTQFNVIGAPGTRATLHDTVTNAGDSPQTVYLHTRRLGAYTTLSNGSVTLSDTTSEHFTDETGTPNDYETYRFRVPAGENRLSVSLSFDAAPGTEFFQVPQLTLIDPRGRLAANDIPQGDANFGNSQVTDPTAGTWRAIIYAPNAASGGYQGGVLVRTSAARYTSFGAVTPSRITLKPGQTKGLTVRVSTPTTPGDAYDAIVISGRRGENGSDDAGNTAGPTGVTSVPVTLRSVIGAGDRTFTATTTGGNGRAAISGQTFYYGIDVPARSPELNADVTLDGNPNQLFQAWLVSPDGSSESYGTNTYVANAFATKPGPGTTLPGAALHVLTPGAGRWTLIVTFAPVAAGATISEPFSVATNDSAVTATSGGLPDSNGAKLAPGVPHTYDVKVKNTGSAPAFFFADARQSGATSLSLAPLNTASTDVPLSSTSVIPTYLVPTDSTSLTAQAQTTGSEPIQFDTSPGALGDAELGDPDIEGSNGLTSTASFSAPELTAGPWDIAPEIHGAFGLNGAATEPVTTSLTVRTRPFDASVSSSTGDVYADSVDPTALPSFAPKVVGPGQTVTIPVSILAAGSAGSTDHGTLYIDEYYDSVFASFIDPVGDPVVALPYRYSVG